MKTEGHILFHKTVHETSSVLGIEDFKLAILQKAREWHMAFDTDGIRMRTNSQGINKLATHCYSSGVTWNW